LLFVDLAAGKPLAYAIIPQSPLNLTVARAASERNRPMRKHALTKR
jgi:hypothetical protein